MNRFHRERSLLTVLEGEEGGGVSVEMAGTPVSPRGSPGRLLDPRLGRGMFAAQEQQSQSMSRTVARVALSDL